MLIATQIHRQTQRGVVPGPRCSRRISLASSPTSSVNQTNVPSIPRSASPIIVDLLNKILKFLNSHHGFPKIYFRFGCPSGILWRVGKIRKSLEEKGVMQIMANDSTWPNLKRDLRFYPSKCDHPRWLSQRTNRILQSEWLPERISYLQ